jgi:hypothetical protein
MSAASKKRVGQSQSQMISIKIVVLTPCGAAIECGDVPPREGGTFHFGIAERTAP